MKRFHDLNIKVYVLFFALLAVSCIPEQQSIGDAGQTFVKLHPSVYNMLAFDAKTTPQSGLLFEIRRDVPNSKDLNTATTVVLQYDADGSLLTKYNTDHKTNYVPLPANLGTVSPAITAGKLTVTLEAGETGKAIMINVPAAGNFDFSLSYALAFKILSVSGTGKLSADVDETIVCEVLAKNKWDGVYTVTGTFVDYLNAPWTGIYPKIVELRTTGANTCSKYDADYGLYGYIFETGGGASQFGAWTPAFSFDANNNVNVFNTTTDSPARGRTAVLYTGEGAINKYDPATKTMNVAYYLSQLNVSPVLRSLVTEKYTYKGPR
ncbi:MAG TPA: hypothetical protein DCR40_04460 [Prolixibacteraceae bacterium]|nr:hypothetical protein [Prolixibacteraceae bacterium]